MAIVLRGLTECPICQNVLQDHDNIISFPALFHETHKYHLCSDAAFHVSCFNQWEYSEDALKIYEKYLEYWKNEKPVLPEGMQFAEFEKTKEYKEFMRNLSDLLNKE